MLKLPPNYQCATRGAVCAFPLSLRWYPLFCHWGNLQPDRKWLKGNQYLDALFGNSVWLDFGVSDEVNHVQADSEGTRV